LPVTQIELRSLKHQVYSLISTPTKLMWLPDCSVGFILWSSGLWYCVLW